MGNPTLEEKIASLLAWIDIVFDHPLEMVLVIGTWGNEPRTYYCIIRQGDYPLLGESSIESPTIEAAVDACLIEVAHYQP